MREVPQDARRERRSGRIRWIALALAVTAACAAPLDDPERFGVGGDSCPDGVDVETDVLAARCGGSICHSPGEDPAGGLDLVSPGVADRISGVTSPNCAGEVLAVPGDPDASLLIRKLGNQPPCGSRMPLAGELEPGDAACIRDFIADLPAVQAGQLHPHRDRR